MGGGLDVEDGFLTILPGSSVSGNVASGASQVSGGGIVAQSLAGPSSIDGAVIDNNSAVSTYTAEGGGLYLAAFQAATITVTRSQIEDNSAAGPAAALGGGVFAGGNVVLLSDTISGNTPSNCWGSTVTRC
jgi:hypothetical protein